MKRLVMQLCFAALLTLVVAPLSAAEPLILKRRKFSEVLQGADLFAGIPRQLGGELQPERAAGLRAEMPLDHLAHLRIQLLPGFLNLSGKFRRGCTCHGDSG